jgi:hypothetical protein
MISRGQAVFVDAVVVRGGATRDPAAVLENLYDELEIRQAPEISAFIAIRQPNETLEAVIERIARLAPLPHGKLQISTVKTLRNRGFELVADYSVEKGVWHCNIVLPIEATIEDVTRLIGAFQDPILNPVPRSER